MSALSTEHILSPKSDDFVHTNISTLSVVREVVVRKLWSARFWPIRSDTEFPAHPQCTLKRPCCSRTRLDKDDWTSKIHPVIDIFKHLCRPTSAAQDGIVSSRPAKHKSWR